MKKILSVLLILCCMMAVCSCNLIDGMGGNDDTATGVGAFTTAISNTNAANVVVTTEVEDTLGTLLSQLEVNFNNDGSANIKYTYEKFNEIGEGAEDEIKSVVVCDIVRAADGTYSGDVPAGLDLSSVSASASLNLAPVKDDAEINEVGDVLTVNVSAANSAAVYGSELTYDSTLTIFVANGVVSQIEIVFEKGKIVYQYD